MSGAVAAALLLRTVEVLVRSLPGALFLSDVIAACRSEQDRRSRCRGRVPGRDESRGGGHREHGSPPAPTRLCLWQSDRWLMAGGIALFSLLAGVVLFDRAIAQPFSYDEHQFVSAGWWLARQGLLPYLDIPYHHMPYQIPLNVLAVCRAPTFFSRAGSFPGWLPGWRPCSVRGAGREFCLSGR